MIHSNKQPSFKLKVELWLSIFICVDMPFINGKYSCDATSFDALSTSGIQCDYRIFVLSSTI